MIRTLDQAGEVGDVLPSPDLSELAAALSNALALAIRAQRRGPAARGNSLSALQRPVDRRLYRRLCLSSRARHRAQKGRDHATSIEHRNPPQHDHDRR